MAEEAALTADVVRKTIKAWLEYHGVEYDYQSQWRALHLLCADASLVESRRLSEDEDTFWERLNQAHDILWGAWYSTAPDIAKGFFPNNRQPTETEKQVIERAKRTLWRRHDPMEALKVGFASPHHVDIDIQGLTEAVAAYLDRTWLRSPILDWLFLDMLVTNELIQYGQTIKYAHLPGPHDDFDRHLFHNKHKGNIAAIQKAGAKYRPRPVRQFFLAQILVPVAAVTSCFYFDYVKTAIVIACLGILDLAMVLVRATVRSTRRSKLTMEEKLTPSQREFRRWDQMYAVWRKLSGPVVNPSQLRECMVRTTESGAVWGSAAWAIVDLVVARNPAVWIVQKT